MGERESERAIESERGRERGGREIKESSVRGGRDYVVVLDRGYVILAGASIRIYGNDVTVAAVSFPSSCISD